MPPDAAEFRFSKEKLERSFASFQPVDDSVQSTQSTTPGCCSRTSMTIACRAESRRYSLCLPLASKLPNETPDAPPQNRRAHVMKAPCVAPVLQVLSVREGKGVAEISVVAEGPAQCPPGTPNRVAVQGVRGASRDVPFTDWSWKAPALFDEKLLAGTPTAELIELLHPFKAAELPAQTWSVMVPGCSGSRLKGSVAAFPDVRWSGQLTVRSEPDESSRSGFAIKVDGDLSCAYGAGEFKIDTFELAKALCPWLECVDPIARCAAATMTLRPAARFMGYDTPLLERHGEFRWQPWPRLSLRVTSHLFEQPGNGLLGHQLGVQAGGDTFIGARGEISLLPKWLQAPNKTRLLAPMLAGIDARSIGEVTQEIGLWLVADGDASIEAKVEARLPDQPARASGRARGAVRMEVQARSIRDYDCVVARTGAAQDVTRPGGFHVACKPPPESPVGAPVEKTFHASLAFTGCAVAGFEKHTPGCIFRPLAEPDSPPPAPVVMVPERSWPSGVKPGGTAEVNWCA